MMLDGGGTTMLRWTHHLMREHEMTTRNPRPRKISAEQLAAIQANSRRNWNQAQARLGTGPERPVKPARTARRRPTA